MQAFCICSFKNRFLPFCECSTVLLLQMEMVGDISLVIPNLIAIFVSKMVADQLSKPLFKCQLEAKALPHLDQEPKVIIAGKMYVDYWLKCAVSLR